eukprot:gene8095-8288_t
MRLQDHGGRAKGRGGSGSSKGRRKSVLVNVTCGSSFTEDAPCPEYFDALLLSLTPTEYSSASSRDTGGFNFISPAQAQQGIHPPVACSSGSSFDSLISGANSGRLRRWASRRSLPYQATSYNVNCEQGRNALPRGGSLRLVDAGNNLDSLARVKEAILLHGGVLTSMVVWSDFRSYPGPRRQAGVNSLAQGWDVYRSTTRPASDKSGSEELHAVFCYGWKDTSRWVEKRDAFAGGRLQGYLLCKNSWGTQWGLNGTFKIAYGAAFVLPPDYTLGMEFVSLDREQASTDILNFNSVRSSGATTAPSKQQIVEDIILSNIYYDGRGTAANVSLGWGTDTSVRVNLLTALIHRTESTSSSSSPLPFNFLLCNRSAELLVGPPPPPPSPSPLPRLICQPGTQPNYTANQCIVCPLHQYRDEAMEFCSACPPRTGTVLGNIPSDRDELSDCAPLVTEGPENVLLEISRTPPNQLAQGQILFGLNWFERMCPLGQYITSFVVRSSNFINQLSAVCSEGALLAPVGAGVDVGSEAVISSPPGYVLVTAQRSNDGLQAVRFMLPDGSETGWFGNDNSSSWSGVSSAVPLFCTGAKGERVIGYYGRSAAWNKIPILSALGVICGNRAGSQDVYSGTFRTPAAGDAIAAQGAGGVLDSFSANCRGYDWVMTLEGWASGGTWEALQMVCSRQTLPMTVFGSSLGSDAIRASSMGGFKKVDIFIANYTRPQQGSSPQLASFIAGLTVLDGSGSNTSWGSVHDADTAPVSLTCDDGVNDARMTGLYGITVTDTDGLKVASLGLSCASKPTCK